MNKYIVYFKDGTSKEIWASCESDARFKISMTRPTQDIQYIIGGHSCGMRKVNMPSPAFSAMRIVNQPIQTSNIKNGYEKLKTELETEQKKCCCEYFGDYSLPKIKKNNTHTLLQLIIYQIIVFITTFSILTILTMLKINTIETDLVVVCLIISISFYFITSKLNNKNPNKVKKVRKFNFNRKLRRPK